MVLKILMKLNPKDGELTKKVTLMLYLVRKQDILPQQGYRCNPCQLIPYQKLVGKGLISMDQDF
jgi:hypothetical protein